MLLRLLLAGVAAAAGAAPNGTVPGKFVGASIIVQYGTPRSATTAQWVIVSAYACALGLEARVRKTHQFDTAIQLARGGALRGNHFSATTPCRLRRAVLEEPASEVQRAVKC